MCALLPKQCKARPQIRAPGLTIENSGPPQGEIWKWLSNYTDSKKSLLTVLILLVQSNNSHKTLTGQDWISQKYPEASKAL